MTISEEAKDCNKAMLQRDPERRIGYDELFAHPLLAYASDEDHRAGRRLPPISELGAAPGASGSAHCASTELSERSTPQDVPGVQNIFSERSLVV